MSFTDEAAFIYLNKELCDDDNSVDYHQTELIEYDYKGKKYPMEKYLRTEDLFEILGKIDTNFDKIKACIDIKNSEIDSLIKVNKKQEERINELEQRINELEKHISTFKNKVIECVSEMDNGIRGQFNIFNTRFAKYLQLQEEEKQEKEEEYAVLKTKSKSKQTKRKRNLNGNSQGPTPSGRECKKSRR